MSVTAKSNLWVVFRDVSVYTKKKEKKKNEITVVFRVSIGDLQPVMLYYVDIMYCKYKKIISDCLLEYIVGKTFYVFEFIFYIFILIFNSL